MSRIRDEIHAHATTTVEKGSGGWRQSFCLPPSFAGFDGHFPGNPVVPAVVQLMLGQILAEAVCGRRPFITRVVKAKFLKPLRPLENIQVSCMTECEKASCCHIEIAGNAELAAVFRLELSEGPA